MAIILPMLCRRKTNGMIVNSCYWAFLMSSRSLLSTSESCGVLPGAAAGAARAAAATAFSAADAWVDQVWGHGKGNYPTKLVGGIPTPLKNMKVSWDDYSQYME